MDKNVESKLNNDSLDRNGKSLIMKYIGQAQGTLEMIREIIPTLATKEMLHTTGNDLSKRIESLRNDMRDINARLNAIETYASREGGKNGARWAIAISLIFFMLNVLVVYFLKGQQ